MFDLDEPFLLAIKDVGEHCDRGVTVTGRVERGVVKINDEAEIIGITKVTRRATVTGIEMFRRPLEEAVAGDPGVTLLLRGVTHNELEGGQIVIKPGAVDAYYEFRATVRILPEHDGGRPVSHKWRGKFFFRTVAIPGEISFLGNTESAVPGDEREMNVTLDCPVGMDEKTTFEIHGDRGVFDRFAIGQVSAMLS